MRLFLLLPKWGARFCEGYLERRRGAAPSVVGPVAQTLLHLYLEAREREKALKLLGRPDLGGALVTARAEDSESLSGHRDSWRSRGPDLALRRGRGSLRVQPGSGRTRGAL